MSITKPAYEPALHQLSQNHVAQQHDRKQQPVQRRKLDQPQRGSQGRNRQRGAYRYDIQGGGDQRPACPTLDERDFVCANDVDDQRLSEERFHEPAGVEQGGVMQQSNIYSIMKNVR